MARAPCQWPLDSRDIGHACQTAFATRVHTHPSPAVPLHRRADHVAKADVISHSRACTAFKCLSSQASLGPTPVIDCASGPTRMMQVSGCRCRR